MRRVPSGDRFLVKNRTPLDAALFPASKGFGWLTCEKCRRHLPGVEFVGFDDPTRLWAWCKECRLKYPYPVADAYVRLKLRLGTSVPAEAEWPADLVRLAKLRTQMKWLMKNHKLNEDNQRDRATVLRRD